MIVHETIRLKRGTPDILKKRAPLLASFLGKEKIKFGFGKFIKIIQNWKK